MAGLRRGRGWQRHHLLGAAPDARVLVTARFSQLASEPPMSQLGQKATLQGVGAMSALTPNADNNRRRYEVCLVPKADVPPVPPFASQIRRASAQSAPAQCEVRFLL
jgi:hypothetical protein